MRVLVCDDDAATRYVLRRLLTQTLGCTVIECGDGIEALKLVDAGGLDMMVLDIEMPLIDGVEVLEAIRQSPRCKHLPVVMLSKERREDVIRRLVTLGICTYVLKPLRPERFIATLESLIPTLRPCARNLDGADASSIRLRADSPALLADGDADYRQFFASQTERYGPIVVADSGVSALTAFRRSPTALAFVGTDLGVVGVELLTQKLRAAAGDGLLRIVGITDGKESAEVRALFDDVTPRTYVVATHAAQIRRFVQMDGPLEAVSILTGGLIKVVASATAQVFGMMLDTDVVPWTGDADEPELVAVIDMTILERFTVSVAVHLTAPAARAIAARMTNSEADAVSDDKVAETVAELVNLVTGRIVATLGERSIASECTAPRTERRPAATMLQPADDAGFVLRFTVSAIDVRLAIAITVTDHGAAVAAATTVPTVVEETPDVAATLSVPAAPPMP
jgi:two-component system chemotaxis response regulator CheY